MSRQLEKLREAVVLSDQIVAMAEALAKKKARQKIRTYFPDRGPLRRELYQKHLEFFRAGAVHRQRGVLAANRIGKTESMSLYELTLHLTGDYPAWWEGRRFDKAIRSWACGETAETVRDILQRKLLGPMGDWGTGLIPFDRIDKRANGELRITRASGVADAVDTIYVKHAAGGVSECSLKSYRKGESSFPGTEMDVIALDEEAPIEIKTECLMRLMTTNGLLMQTFTPLNGMSEGVLDFLPGGDWKTLGSRGSKYTVMAGWDDVPHLTEEDKRISLEGIHPHQREARSKGIPQLGSGAIYPVPESDITVDDFKIPDHWPREYKLDVGWNRTAALWWAIDRETDTRYVYAEYYRSEAEPIVHATGIRAHGDWIPGDIDPAANGRGQADGKRLVDQYQKLGLNLGFAINDVESGLVEAWGLLSTGRIKVFKSLSNFFTEYRLYRRDDKGRIVKKDDHLMDCLRYLVNGRGNRAKVKPMPEKAERDPFNTFGRADWMGA